MSLAVKIFLSVRAYYVAAVRESVEFFAYTVRDGNIVDHVLTVKVDILEILIVWYHHAFCYSEAAKPSVVAWIESLALKLGDRINKLCAVH